MLGDIPYVSNVIFRPPSWMLYIEAYGSVTSRAGALYFLAGSVKALGILLNENNLEFFILLRLVCIMRDISTETVSFI